MPGGKPHLLNPPAPHDCGEVHVPHCRRPPQPSLAGPQLYPSDAHVFGVHRDTTPPSALTPGGRPHRLNPPAPHVAGVTHVPHCRRLPQPSAAGPQSYPWEAHVAGVHEGPPSEVAVGIPHLLKPPPPHVSGDMQVPQSRMPPQPSPFLPHV
jgi:hypothetical protein